MIGGTLAAVTGIGAYLLITKKKKAMIPKTTASLSGFAATGVSATPQAQITEEPNWNKPFNYGYLDEIKQWLAPRTIKQLAPPKALEYARSLKQAKGIFNDDEARVKSIFAKRLQDKTQVSSIARAFYATYSEDLWQHLRSFLSDNELKTLVTDPVRRLPNYQLSK